MLQQRQTPCILGRCNLPHWPCLSIVCPAMRTLAHSVWLVVKRRSRVDPGIWIGSTPPPLWIWPQMVSGVAVAPHRSRFRDTCLALFNTRTTTCSDPACLRKELFTAFQAVCSLGLRIWRQTADEDASRPCLPSASGLDAGSLTGTCKCSLDVNMRPTYAGGSAMAWCIASYKQGSNMKSADMIIVFITSTPGSLQHLDGDAS